MKVLIPQSEFEKKLSRIKLLLLDVDGILTNGGVFHVPGQGWTRTYNIYDGYGIKLMMRAGITVGIISGGQSEELKERLKILGISHAVLGSEDKLSSMKKITSETGISPEDTCFMGDDLFDIGALRAVGLAITVPEAMPEVHENVHAITRRSGGHGAVREVIDLIRKIQNHPSPF
jgi:3-deoxy-D-manno-octulosonate 8-phosphate phosphatase (KDO 8-P phosphatase)